LKTNEPETVDIIVFRLWLRKARVRNPAPTPNHWRRVQPQLVTWTQEYLHRLERTVSIEHKSVREKQLLQALTMIERSGLDRTRALEILTQGAPGSPLVRMVSARMTAADYTPNFLLRLMAKDLGYSIQEAGKLSMHLATAQAALETFQKAITAGYGDQDIAAAVELLRAEKGR
jgi:hypothetical protein